MGAEVGAAREPSGPLGFGPPAPVVCFFIAGLRLAVVPRSHWLRCGDVASFAYDIETSQRFSPVSRRDPGGPGAVVTVARGTDPRRSRVGGPRIPPAPVTAVPCLSRKRGCVSPPVMFRRSWWAKRGVLEEECEYINISMCQSMKYVIESQYESGWE